MADGLSPSSILLTILAMYSTKDSCAFYLKRGQFLGVKSLLLGDIS